MFRWRSVSTVAVAALLALPAAAPAQNAGDQQYTDPLAPGQGDGGGGDSGSTAPAPSSPSSGSQGTAGAAQGAPAATQSQAGGDSDGLPRTGFPAGLIALLGAGFVAAGAGLRRRLS